MRHKTTSTPNLVPATHVRPKKSQEKNKKSKKTSTKTSQKARSTTTDTNLKPRSPTSRQKITPAEIQTDLNELPPAPKLTSTTKSHKNTRKEIIKPRKSFPPKLAKQP
jgi:hypothetical protein